MDVWSVGGELAMAGELEGGRCEELEIWRAGDLEEAGSQKQETMEGRRFREAEARRKRQK